MCKPHYFLLRYHLQYFGFVLFIFCFVYHISTICTKCVDVASGDIYYAKIVSQIAFANITGVQCVDVALGLLLAILDKQNISSDTAETVLTEISNIMGYLSDRSVLVNVMDKIVSYRGAAEVTYTSIG